MGNACCDCGIIINVFVTICIGIDHHDILLLLVLVLVTECIPKYGTLSIHGFARLPDSDLSTIFLPDLTKILPIRNLRRFHIILPQ
jgi:hypothetical protein